MPATKWAIVISSGTAFEYFTEQEARRRLALYKSEPRYCLLLTGLYPSSTWKVQEIKWIQTGPYSYTRSYV